MSPVGYREDRRRQVLAAYPGGGVSGSRVELSVGGAGQQAQTGKVGKLRQSTATSGVGHSTWMGWQSPQ